MKAHNVKLIYPKDQFHIILQNSEKVDEFYAIDEFERKRLKIIQAKYGCRHCFHTLPDKVTLNLNKFFWNEECQCFQIETDQKVKVRLNTLEEAIVDYIPNDHLP